MLSLVGSEMCIRDRRTGIEKAIHQWGYTPGAAATSLRAQATGNIGVLVSRVTNPFFAGLFDAICLLYTSDAADDLLCVDLGGRLIIKKKKKKYDN